MCDHVMTEVPVTVSDGVLKLDVCKICQFFWLDPKEFESLPAAQVESSSRKKPLPQAAREAIAIAEVRRMSEQAQAQDPSPDEAWKVIPAIFGFPVEVCSNPLSRPPFATWTLSAIIAI